MVLWANFKFSFLKNNALAISFLILGKRMVAHKEVTIGLAVLPPSSLAF
jgi:hypothetical protein